MRHILTNNISQKAGFIIGPDTLTHLQQSYKEIIDSLVKMLVTSPSGTVILHGAVVTQDGQNFSNTAGAAYRNGEIYQIDAGVLNDVPGGQTAIWVEDISFLGTDPVMFTDGNIHFVHQFKKLKLAAGAPGPDDFTQVKYPANISFLENRIVDYVNGLQSQITALQNDKYNKLQGAWTAVTGLEEGYSNPVGEQAMYRKDEAGRVEFRGRIVVDSPPGTTAFTLPVGFRPPNLSLQLTVSAPGPGVKTAGTVLVWHTGEFHFEGGIPPNGSLYLDPVRFSTY